MAGVRLHPQLPLRCFFLKLNHAPVKTALGQQFFRGALLCHTAILQHDNMIGTGHSTHPVGDDQHRFTLKQAGESFLNSTFVFNIQAGGCLIQKNDRRVFKQGAGDGNPLAFTAGEGRTDFSDHGLINLRKFLYKFIAPGSLSSCEDFFVRSSPASQTDIFHYRVPEQHYILENHRVVC